MIDAISSMNHILPCATVDAHVSTNINFPPVTKRIQRLMRAKLQSPLLSKRHQPRAESLSTHSLISRDTSVAFVSKSMYWQRVEHATQSRGSSQALGTPIPLQP